MVSSLKKILQLLIMLVMAYSGSFLMMEETSEKAEKTERSEEALHSRYHASGFQIIIIKKRREVNQSLRSHEHYYQTFEIGHTEQSNYNIDHIYFSSYLRLHV